MKTRKTSIRFGLGMVWAASSLGAVAGCSEYTLYPLPQPRAYCDMTCRASTQSRYDGTVAGEQLGAAVEIAAWGSLGTSANPTLAKVHRTAFAGAPQYAINGARVGRVVMQAANTASGELANTTAPLVLDAPEASTREFGTSLLAVDVREGHTEAVRIPGQLVSEMRAVGWGEELLVGAPGTDASAGAVYWHENQGAAQRAWTVGGVIRSPAPTENARFGASLAARFDLDARASARPAWIAIGAPGQSRVYLFLVVATSGATSFVHTQTVVGEANSEFGARVAIAELNGDAFPELVVGAPREAGGGRVRVYRGIAGFSPVSASDPLRLAADGALAGGGEYGASLAVGRIDRNPGSALPGLVVGAPGFDADGATDRGGICQYFFRSTNGGAVTVRNQRCDMNPVARDNERYGHAVAVGNFSAAPAPGEESFACAAGDEIAVGVPGRSRSTSTSREGAVVILPRGAEGGVVLGGGLTLWGTDPEERMGMSLAAEYVGASDSEDLLVGSPSRNGARGRIALTRAVPANGSDPLSGVWTGRDSSQQPFRVRVTWNASAGQLAVEMLDAATMTFRNGTATCSVFGQPLTGSAKVTFAPLAWASTPTTYTAHFSVPANTVVPNASGNVSGALTFNAVTGRLTLAIDEHAGALTWAPNSCAITNNPFVFTRTEATTCD